VGSACDRVLRPPEGHLSHPRTELPADPRPDGGPSLSRGLPRRSREATQPGATILFLDEPTIGLNAASKLAVRDFTKRLNREDRVTVILTTHDMDDIYALCTRERRLIVDLTEEGDTITDPDAAVVSQEGHRESHRTPRGPRPFRREPTDRGDHRPTLRGTRRMKGYTAVLSARFRTLLQYRAAARRRIGNPALLGPDSNDDLRSLLSGIHLRPADDDRCGRRLRLSRPGLHSDSALECRQGHQGSDPVQHGAVRAPTAPRPLQFLVQPSDRDADRTYSPPVGPPRRPPPSRGAGRMTAIGNQWSFCE